MKKILKSMAMSCLFLGAAILTGCTGEQYHIEGEISNAKDSVLYFEHNSLKGFTTVDSVKLTKRATSLSQAIKPKILSFIVCV